MKRMTVIALCAFLAGCAVNATVGARIGKAPAPTADLTAVQRLVCRGDIVGAEGLLTARGYDFASAVEAIERAKLKCEPSK